MYPRLLINLEKLSQNLDACARMVHQAPGCTLMVVTKGVCADPQVVRMVLDHPDVDFVADSRIQNIRTFSAEARKAGKRTVLLRLPMHSEIPQVLEHVDLSLNSELSTIRLLNEAAGRMGKVHDVLLMIDLGDLREGVFFQNEEEIAAMVGDILSLEHIRLYGLGVNLTCYGAIIPKHDNLSQLTELARRLEARFDLRFPMVSGGNSSSIYLIERGELPEGINNLRLGESVLLGNDTAYGTRLPGTAGDALVLETEIIELKEKPSFPLGEIGVDAFGQRPRYEDKGLMRRAIIGIGRQDADLDNMTPVDPSIQILGGSSDHIILDLSRCATPYKVGDTILFTLGYGGMLRAATSPYVERACLRP